MWARPLHENGRTFRIEVGHQPITIGRGENANVRVQHESVSKQHVALQLQTDGKVAIVDLGSSNGTLVEGDQLERRERAVLVSGSILALGRLVRFEIIRVDIPDELVNEFADEVTKRDNSTAPKIGTHSRPVVGDSQPHARGDHPRAEKTTPEKDSPMGTQKLLDSHASLAGEDMWQAQRRWREAMERVHDFYLAALDGLLEQFPGQFVAIQDDKIVAVGPDADALVAKVDAERAYLIAPIAPNDDE